MNRSLLAAVLAVTSLAGCAGRDPYNVQIATGQDTGLDCAGLQAEIENNNKRIDELDTEQNWKAAQNYGAAIAGLIVWPVLFLTDFKGGAETDQENYEARNKYLASLLATKDCGGAGGQVARSGPNPTVKVLSDS